MPRLASPSSVFRVGLLAAHLGVAACRVEADDFPNPPDTEPIAGAPMAPAEAAARFRLPEGFRASVFASEPDVRNPIGMAWDARGRLWIAENYTYAERSQKFDLRLRDRVIVLEDRDGDGKAERRTVFTDTVQRLTSVELGHRGVWLLCPPQLLFVPDANGDDVPDGPAEVVLDGFTVPPENYHNFANGLRWGPDGWLYGRCGCSAPGRLGAPGTPDDRRVPLNGGLWRYHPRTRAVEVLTHGTTNPWGHDWNALGEAFFINTVNGHLWHAVAGMHFVRPHTVDPNPSTYELIDQHADHWHWDNARDWTDSRNVSGEHDRRGGGHAHSGLMIDPGDAWPEPYRRGLFTLNLHGRRINHDALEREGSGYVGRHRPDFAFAADPWFRGIELSAGPDGSVYVLDWSDTGECHESTGVHRSSGRIYRISYDTPRRSASFDLARDSTAELVRHALGGSPWHARQARRLLAEREARNEPLDEARNALRRHVAAASSEPASTLRALWALHATSGADRRLLVGLLEHREEAVRAWAIRLLTERLPLDTVMGQRPKDAPPIDRELRDVLVRRAVADPSALVRLILASTLQRLPHADRAALASPLMAHSEDASDHNLPLLIWYGLMPLGETDPLALAKLAPECRLPTTRRLIARRLADGIDRAPAGVDALVGAIGTTSSDALRADLLRGLAEGLRGRLKVVRPAGWETVASVLAKSTDRAVRDPARDLSALFGDGRAVAEVRAIALDAKADLPTRRAALESLIASGAPDLRAVCLPLLKVRFLNPTAARGLSQFGDAEVARALAESYRSFHPSERAVLLDVLVSRPMFARALLDRIAAGTIARSDLSVFQARQIRAHRDDALNQRLIEVWGAERETNADRRALIASLRKQLDPGTLSSASAARGRVVFERVCATCHTLYGRGGEAGPDLTGAGRQDLDYLLENIVDPSATVSADFRMVSVALHDGRVLNGIVAARSERGLTLRTPNGTIALDRASIDEERATTESLMPDGLLAPLRPEEVRDLFAYLMTRTQVPLPAGVEPAGATPARP
ncbi:MAG: PVC-type heme-binding CxxCH protein [Isosphaeraceae bacterium]